jgi:hypothetical protein
MPGEKRPLTRRDVAVIIVIVIGVIASFVALIQWEMSRECVRWSPRIDATSSGQIRRTQVCAEFRPRRFSEEPPFDPSSPKDK